MNWKQSVSAGIYLIENNGFIKRYRDSRVSFLFDQRIVVGSVIFPRLFWADKKRKSSEN